ncbi:MAG: hypothetical protein ACJASY_000007 [Halioglobus sp.]|jgi:hypothetical protein
MLLTGLANYLLVTGSVGYLAAPLFLLSLFCWLKIFRESLVGCTFGWRDGQWYVFSGRGVQTTELVGRFICIAGFVRIRLRSHVTGEQFNFSLFSDSADRADLRRLRSRLVLER